MTGENAESADTTYRPILGLLVGVGFLGGFFAGVTVAPTQATPAEEVPTVECMAFDSNGSTSGMCFVSGDVDFRWIGDGNSTTGNVSLEELPKENATVRRKS